MSSSAVNPSQEAFTGADMRSFLVQDKARLRRQHPYSETRGAINGADPFTYSALS